VAHGFLSECSSNLKEQSYISEGTVKVESRIKKKENNDASGVVHRLSIIT